MKHALSLLILFGCAVQPAEGQARLGAALDSVLVRFEENATPFNGVLLVGDAEGVRYQRATGYANFELGVPVEPDNRFRIASISKQFGGMLAVLLAEDGLVDLRAPVETYLPELQGTPAGAATLHHLLTHRSGLSGTSGYLWDNVISVYQWNWRTNQSTDAFSADSFLVHIAAETQEEVPGSTYAYCNECYVLAGMALGAAAKTEYEPLLNERILRPLGMEHTGLERLDQFIEKRAYPYERTPNGVYPITRWRNLYPLGPAGGMYSTSGDLQRWADALFHSDVLLSRSVREQFLPRDEGYHYGISRTTLTLGEGREADLISHTGQIAGTYALVAYLPEHGVHLIALSNIGFTFPQQNFLRAVVAAVVGTGSP